ncbi:hypothetical protein [Stygiolobus caldivivus]|uniref:hypothetical protein n=1 Tax=Stygiolobus caldivivus TaxID=2824673 RepID=UPI001CED9D9F|nr:hypothetical protein [Stygiolobus caldivivus]
MKLIWERVKEIEERKKELDAEIKVLTEQLKSLPNGHLEEKLVKGKKYYYLRYWEDGKLKSKYVGKDIGDLVEKFRLASEIKIKIDKLKRENERLGRILEKIRKIIDEDKTN